MTSDFPLWSFMTLISARVPAESMKVTRERSIRTLDPGASIGFAGSLLERISGREVDLAINGKPFGGPV
jgi:hypothetical protein